MLIILIGPHAAYYLERVDEKGQGIGRNEEGEQQWYSKTALQEFIIGVHCLTRLVRMYLEGGR